MALTVRPARPDDLPMLQADLAQDSEWEQVQLQRGIVFVVEKDGVPVMMTHARLAWQIEPTKFLVGKRDTLNAHEQRKATYLAIRAIEGYLANRENNPFIRFYFTAIKRVNTVMCDMAKRWGMIPVYGECEFFGKDL